MRLIRRHKLESRVYMLGYRTDVPALMKMADVYTTCSKREGLSRTISEAMALGLPCVVSNRRGMKDLVDDGLGGYLVEPTEYKGLASRLDQTISLDEEKRRAICKHNQDKIRQFSSEIVVEEMKKILNEADSLVKQNGYSRDD